MLRHSAVTYRKLILTLKYLPIIGALSMLWHVGLLLLGETPMLMHFLFGYSLIGGMLLWVASDVMRFCIAHKMLNSYVVITELCIKIQAQIGFGPILTPMRWIILILGIILTIWFLGVAIKRKWHAKSNIGNYVTNARRTLGSEHMSTDGAGNL